MLKGFKVLRFEDLKVKWLKHFFWNTSGLQSMMQSLFSLLMTSRTDWKVVPKR